LDGSETDGTAATVAGLRIGLVSALVRTSGLVQQVLVTTSAELGLTAQQAQLLCIVDHAPVNMRQLSALMRVRKSGMTGLVDRARAAGLIVRQPDPHDGRSWLVELTTDGQTTVREFKRLVSTQIERMLMGIAEPERETVEAALTTLVLANEFPDTWPDD
jgi:DNA-binding MarR family transcriptional regulator